MTDAPRFPCKVEADRYYQHINPYTLEGDDGPKLVYRTSQDAFRVGEADTIDLYYRTNRDDTLRSVEPVPKDHALSKQGLWDSIRDQTVNLLDSRNIQMTSVDLVRFCADTARDSPNSRLWYSKLTTNPTIWIGVRPDTLTSNIAHEASQSILALLEQQGISGVDVAFRESTVQFLQGRRPALLPPSREHLLQNFADKLSTSTGLSITGRDMSAQGTLGPFFVDGNHLNAITARHVLFDIDNEPNEEYYHQESSPKREVLMMSDEDFEDLLSSITAELNSMNRAIQKDMDELRQVLAHPRPQQDDFRIHGYWQPTLKTLRIDINYLESRKSELEIFLFNLKKLYGPKENRIIGYVLWSPPLNTIGPGRYTTDLCVVRLYQEKFRHFFGNGFNLGPEKYLPLYYDLREPFEPVSRNLVHIHGLVPASEIGELSEDSEEEETPNRVLKRGGSTDTTYGNATNYMSHVRRCLKDGTNFDSIEVPILSRTEVFCRPGDSGSLIVSSKYKCLAMLTSGAVSRSLSPDIAYATPFEWVWELVKSKFPGASLEFGNVEVYAVRPSEIHWEELFVDR
ncbi:hypothetical protein ONZ45_g4710 [Pleurotus djamor]|nr:hypothetical protein ONZ45_g4710 [Pleurotus djamor]